ncbi:MAG: FcoT family thioesterase [Candidatus Woesearchaeota archaeon]
MVNIKKSTLDAILEPYKPAARYLKSAELEYPKITGVFEISQPCYVDSTGHFNAVDLLICYNQLSYAGFAEAGQMGVIPELGIIPLEEFRQLQLQNMLIAHVDKMRFKKPISAKQIHGAVTVEKIIPAKMNSLYFFKTAYNFENGKATGEIDLAHIRTKQA